MDKVYLLLRNNQQTGPYHLDELVQQNLRPDDLIWTEGKSITWLYPSEYEELKPYVSPPHKLPGDTIASSNEKVSDISASHHTANIRHIYVSLPDKPAPATHPKGEAESLEQQAEALRKRVAAYALAHPPAQTAESQPPAYIPKTVTDLEQDYITWLHRQTRTRRNRAYKKIGVAALIILSLSGGYLLAKDGLITKQTAALTANRSLHSESAQKAKQRTKMVPQSTMIATILPDTTAIADTMTTLPVTNSKTSTHTKQRIATIKIPVPKVPDTQSNNLTDRPPVVLDSNKIIIIKEDKSSAGVTVNSNSLGQKISRLFKKHKHRKEDEKDGHSPVEKADILLTATHNISGATNVKVTLRNRSDETIKTAAVEVRYYNKQNSLIEKKLVHFNNISPHDTAMQVFHSHPSTDHIYYQLLSANSE